MDTRTAVVNRGDAASLPTPHAPPPTFPLLRASGLALLVFAAVAPTLSWLQFSSGSENLVVETVLEMRRGGPWLVPTLELQPRTQKPPLTAWLTAAAVRPSTVAALGQPDSARRDAAYNRLAWEIRWTALAAACLTLVAVYGLGRAVGGARLGLLSAAVCGTTAIFLRYGRYSTTDVQLALWVGVANWMLARAVIERRWWSGCLVGGVALGLALMSKGPVCLLQSVVPVAVFAVWWRGSRPDSDCGAGVPPASADLCRPEARTTKTTKLVWPILAGLLVMLAVGLSWYLYLFARSPSVIGLWTKEVTRRGATDDKPDPWYTYAIFLPLLLPWSVFFVVGLVGATRQMLARRRDPVVLPLLLTALPILVMTVASPDLKDRYLLPMVGPAAVLSAWGVREILTHVPPGGVGLPSAVIGCDALGGMGKRLRLPVRWPRPECMDTGRLSPAHATRLAGAPESDVEGTQVRSDRSATPGPSVSASPQAGGAVADRGARLALSIHWALLAAVAVGLPLVGAWPHGPLRTRGGGPWYPWSLAVPAAAGLGLVVANGIVLCRRWRGALPAATVAVMLVVQALAVYGYGRSEDGMSGMKPMADAIRAAYPDAVAYYHNPHRRAPNDLSIYLDRPTVQLKDPGQLAPSERPQVAVLVQRHGTPPPQLPPPWRFVTKVERDRDWLHAFVLPPAEAAGR